MHVSSLLDGNPHCQRPPLHPPAAATPHPAAAPGTQLTAIGWGYVDDQQTDPKVLMEVRRLKGEVRVSSQMC